MWEFSTRTVQIGSGPTSFETWGGFTPVATPPADLRAAHGRARAQLDPWLEVESSYDLVGGVLRALSSRFLLPIDRAVTLPPVDVAALLRTPYTDPDLGVVGVPALTTSSSFQLDPAALRFLELLVEELLPGTQAAARAYGPRRDYGDVQVAGATLADLSKAEAHLDELVVLYSR